jgi:hypothetical protein
MARSAVIERPVGFSAITILSAEGRLLEGAWRPTCERGLGVESVEGQHLRLAVGGARKRRSGVGEPMVSECPRNNRDMQ